jgi:hypothetical protein
MSFMVSSPVHAFPVLPDFPPNVVVERITQPDALVVKGGFQECHALFAN